MNPWLPIGCLLLCACLLGAAFQAPPLRAQEEALAGCRTLRVDLVAYGLEDGRRQYRGLHVQRLEDGIQRIVQRFTNLDNETVLRVSARYRDRDLAPIAYELRLPKLGRREWVRRDGETVTLGVREAADAAPETEVLQLTGDTVFAPSVVFYALRHWEALAAGRTLMVRMLVPARTDAFQVTLKRDDDSPLGGPDKVVLLLQPEDLILQQVVDPVRFVFEAQAPHRLLEVRGRTPLRGPDGDVRHLRIVYRYREGCGARETTGALGQPVPISPEATQSR